MADLFDWIDCTSLRVGDMIIRSSNMKKMETISFSRYYFHFDSLDYFTSEFGHKINLDATQTTSDGTVSGANLTIRYPGVMDRPRHSVDLGASVDDGVHVYGNSCFPISIVSTGSHVNDVTIGGRKPSRRVNDEAIALKQLMLGSRVEQMAYHTDDVDIDNFFARYSPQRDIVAISGKREANGETMWTFTWWFRGKIPDPAKTFYILYIPSSVQGAIGHYVPFLFV